MPPRERPILNYMNPQTIHHTPIFCVQTFWHRRNGLIAHGNATLQFFYSTEGTISFIVLGVERSGVTAGRVAPFPAPDLFAHPTASQERITELSE